MSAAKKAVKFSDTDYAVFSIFPPTEQSAGHVYVDPLESDGKYLVRKYDTPEFHDLSEYRSLLKDFEQRFLRNVSRGETAANTPPARLDDYIETERENLRSLQKQLAEKETDRELIEKEALTKRWLSTALLARSMRLSKFHINKRIDAHHDSYDPAQHQQVQLDSDTISRLTKVLYDDIVKPDPSSKDFERQTKSAARQRTEIDQVATHLLTGAYPDGIEKALKDESLKDEEKEKWENPALWLIKQCVSRDSNEVTYLAADLRNKRGQADTDSLIGEMKGEPQNIFFSSLDETNFLIKRVYDNRYFKVAQSMQSIDKAVKVAAEIGKDYPDVNRALITMAEAAKHKIQVLHNDIDYKKTDMAYVSARDAVHGLIGEKLETCRKKAGAAVGHIARTRAQKFEDQTADMLMMRNVVDIVYDIALTRDECNKSIEQTKLAISSMHRHRGHSI